MRSEARSVHSLYDAPSISSFAKGLAAEELVRLVKDHESELKEFRSMSQQISKNADKFAQKAFYHQEHRSIGMSFVRLADEARQVTKEIRGFLANFSASLPGVVVKKASDKPANQLQLMETIFE